MRVSADGTLTFFDENGQRVSPANVEVDSTYPRKKGPKTLARVVSNPDKIVLDQNRALSRYDYLFAIDTNTKVVNSVKTSMTVACLIQDVRIENPRWHANLVEQNAIEFQEISEAAEKVGWCEFLAVIKKYELQGSIGLIVDGHLGELPALNARKQPIYRGHSARGYRTIIWVVRRRRRRIHCERCYSALRQNLFAPVETRGERARGSLHTIKSGITVRSMQDLGAP
jgi:hypothetical protein